MAYPIPFEGHTHDVGPPPGLEEMVGRLQIFSNGHCNVACWQLEPNELQAIIDSGGKVFVSVMSGSHDGRPIVFPQYVGSEESCKAVVSDTGKVW